MNKIVIRSKYNGISIVIIVWRIHTDLIIEEKIYIGE